jgi:ribosome-associated protein
LKTGELRHYLDNTTAEIARRRRIIPLTQTSVREAGTSGATPAPLHPAAGADASASADIRAVTRASLDDMKAEDTVEIDLVGRTSLADAMFITTGRSNRHVGSIADKLVEDLKQKGYGRIRVEGMPACDWVLIDAGDIIVHVFRPEVRGFYNLEKMWGIDRPLAEPDQVAS